MIRPALAYHGDTVNAISGVGHLAIVGVCSNDHENIHIDSYREFPLLQEQTPATAVPLVLCEYRIIVRKQKAIQQLNRQGAIIVTTVLPAF